MGANLPDDRRATSAAADGTLPTTLSLPSGARLLVRATEPDDAPALEALYHRLDPEATYRRFFTAMPPGREFFERLTTVAERGGFGVVAVDPDAPPGEAIVAEGDVERVADDTGEVAITVDRRWRGWLGPYLLDVLCRSVSQRGIRNIQADILTCNRPMRALTRHRGEAFLPESDWQTVRVVFGASGTAPSWPEAHGQPRVLVELRSMSFEALAELASAGFDVRACPARRSGAPTCPLLGEAGECPLASGADVIVVALPEGEAQGRLLAAHRDRHPDVPVEVVTASPLRGRDLATAAEHGVIAARRRGGSTS